MMRIMKLKMNVFTEKLINVKSDNDKNIYFFLMSRVVMKSNNVKILFISNNGFRYT